MADNAREHHAERPDLPVCDNRIVDACAVPPLQLHLYWNSVAPMLEAAIAHGLGEFTVKDIADGLINGDFLLWVAVEPGRIFGCAVTTLEEFPQAKHLLVMLGGGPGEGHATVNTLWPVMEAYARLEGCTYVRFHTRRGWARSGMLPPGWRHTHDVIGVPVK